MVGRDCTVAWLVEGNWMAALLDGRLDGALLVAREWNSWMVGRIRFQLRERVGGLDGGAASGWKRVRRLNINGSASGWKRVEPLYERVCGAAGWIAGRFRSCLRGREWDGWMQLEESWTAGWWRRWLEESATAKC